MHYVCFGARYPNCSVHTTKLLQCIKNSCTVYLPPHWLLILLFFVLMIVRLQTKPPVESFKTHFAKPCFFNMTSRIFNPVAVPKSARQLDPTSTKMLALNHFFGSFCKTGDVTLMCHSICCIYFHLPIFGQLLINLYLYLLCVQIFRFDTECICLKEKWDIRFKTKKGLHIETASMTSSQNLSYWNCTLHNKISKFGLSR